MKRTTMRRSPQSRRAKAVAIPAEVRREVDERDQYCIWCGGQGFPNCHVISRAKGGLGIPQNIVKACMECHHLYDNGSTRAERESMKQEAIAHLRRYYPDWSEDKVIYRKWG